jgi:hypothetical protein
MSSAFDRFRAYRWMNNAMASISHLFAGWPYFPQASHADSYRGRFGDRERRVVGLGADRRRGGAGERVV